MINSKDNKKLKEIKKLLKSSKHRKETGLFVIEGLRIIKDAPSSHIKSVFYTNKFKISNKETIDNILKENPSCEIFEVDEKPFNIVCDTKTPQGILAICDTLKTDIDTIIESCNNGTFLILEDLQDPGNLGTIIRTSEACEISAIILSKTCVDVYSPKVVRSTMGTIFRVPVFIAENLENFILKMKDNDITVVGTVLKNAIDLYKTNLDKNIAIAIGNEGSGLSDGLLSLCDENVFIPMGGYVESLNASIAASVIMYEIKRVKHGYGK